MPRAILSVSNKTGLVELAQTLAELGWDMVASGGTAATLRAANLPVTDVQIVTGSPEMLGGRVKTLHPAIHAGILARDDHAQDSEDLAQHGYAPVSMVVCNLYPFEETVRRQGVTQAEAIEHIDIGGVTLLRAAAKNFARVAAVCDPADYPRLIAMLRGAGEIDAATRYELAVKAFAHTRDYDTEVHAYLLRSPEHPAPAAEELPQTLSLGLLQTQTLRYGENPHQQAGFYAAQQDAPPLGGQLIGGKPLSYNNLLDLDAAWQAASAFDQPIVVIIKHQTPTGIATAETLAAAFPPALASDPVSAFGGVIAVNRPVDEAFVGALGDLFVEAIAAPKFTPTAQAALGQSRRNCRLVVMQPEFMTRTWQMRSIRGGFLVQSIDAGDPPSMTWKTVTARQPTDEEMAALQFAWRCAQYVPSNAIVLARPGTTVGIGGGLPSRVDAARLAVQKAAERAAGSVLASDAFFPFPDAVHLAAEAGITAIVQPGGSIRDEQVIEAADEAGLVMVMTGVRHFRH